MIKGKILATTLVIIVLLTSISGFSLTIRQNANKCENTPNIANVHIDSETSPNWGTSIESKSKICSKSRSAFNKNMVNSFPPHFHTGWPQTTEYTIRNNIVFEDLDNNGYKEVILSTYNDNWELGNPFGKSEGQIIVYTHYGKIRYGWPKTIGVVKNSAPVVIDLDNDGDKEILMGYNNKDDIFGGPCHLVAWHHDGSIVQGWEKTFDKCINPYPIAADVNGDGSVEIFFGHIQYPPHGINFYLLDQRGDIMPGWPKFVETGSTVLDPAEYCCFADLDGDNDKEIIATRYLHDYLYAWHHDGSLVDGWPISVSEVRSDITAGDIDNDGKDEIIACVLEDNAICVWEDDGRIKEGWPVSSSVAVVAGPSVGNIDKDKELEIFYPVFGFGFPIYGYNHDGTPVPGFPYGGVYQELGLNSDCEFAIADINDNGKMDIVTAVIYPYWDPSKPHVSTLLYAFEYDEGSISIIDGWPIELGGPVFSKFGYSAPVLDDIDNDGFLEVGVAIYEGDTYDLDEVTKLDGKIIVLDLPYEYKRINMEWPMFHHDSGHSGLYSIMVEIVKPKKGMFHLKGHPIMRTLFGGTILVGITTIEVDGSSRVSKVEFYIDDILKDTDIDFPFEWTWNERAFGKHTIKVIAYDTAGNRASDEIQVIKIG